MDEWTDGLTPQRIELEDWLQKFEGAGPMYQVTTDGKTYRFLGDEIEELTVIFLQAAQDPQNHVLANVSGGVQQLIRSLLKKGWTPPAHAIHEDLRSKPVTQNEDRHYDWCNGNCGGSCERSFKNIERTDGPPKATKINCVVEPIIGTDGKPLPTIMHIHKVNETCGYECGGNPTYMQRIVQAVHRYQA